MLTVSSILLNSVLVLQIILLAAMLVSLIKNYVDDSKFQKELRSMTKSMLKKMENATCEIKLQEGEDEDGDRSGDQSEN